MVKVFRVEHSEHGRGLYSSDGAAMEYDRAVLIGAADAEDINSLWNDNCRPNPDHENENHVMNGVELGGVWLFAFISKKSMLAWLPLVHGRSRLVELGLILATYEVDRKALVVGRFQCACDGHRARRTRTTPLVTRRERREQNGSN